MLTAIPGNQNPPCRIPKISEDARSENQVKVRKETASKSAAIKRRSRNPRNASSSAIGTVTTAPNILSTTHVIRMAVGAFANAAGIWGLACAAGINRPRAGQRMNARTPAIGANQVDLNQVDLNDPGFGIMFHEDPRN